MSTANFEVGYMHLHFPLELALAAGAYPIRMFGAPHPYVLADSHLQSYTCTLARGIMEQWLKGEYDRFCCVVMSHACDTVQRLEAILKHSKPNPPVYSMYFPLNRQSKGSASLLASNMKDLLLKIATHTGADTSESSLVDSLERAAATIDEVRTLANHIMSLHAEGKISYLQLYDMQISAQLIPPQQWIEQARKFISRNESNKPDESLIPIALYSGPILMRQFAELVSELGLKVVFDRSSTGTLILPNPKVYESASEQLLAAQSLDEALQALARRELMRPSDPTSLPSPNEPERRVDAFVRDAKSAGARGIVFMYIKFCEPWAFDAAAMDAACKEQDMRWIMINYEHAPTLPGQTITRLEAFAEII